MYKSAQSLTRDIFRADFIDDDGKDFTVSVYPPKMSVLRSLYELSNKQDEDSMVETIGVLAKILSSNREKRKFSAEEVGDLFDITDVQEFLENFFEWAGNLKKK